jgi:hypothetical protein
MLPYEALDVGKPDLEFSGKHASGRAIDVASDELMHVLISHPIGYPPDSRRLLAPDALATGWPFVLRRLHQLVE